MSDGSRGRYAPSARRREQVARAALQQIVENGHAAMSVSQVASAAGVSERTLYYHFPTREHVLVAALELSDERTTDEIGGRDDDDFTEMDDVVAGLARLGAEHPWLVRLMVYLNARAQEPDHPAHSYFRRHNAEAIRSFATLLRHRQRRGLAHPDLEPEVVARRLVAVWDGLQAQWLVEPDFDLADEISAAFRQLTGQNVMEAKSAFERALA